MNTSNTSFHRGRSSSLPGSIISICSIEFIWRVRVLELVLTTLKMHATTPDIFDLLNFLSESFFLSRGSKDVLADHQTEQVNFKTISSLEIGVADSVVTIYKKTSCLIVDVFIFSLQIIDWEEKTEKNLIAILRRTFLYWQHPYD